MLHPLVLSTACVCLTFLLIQGTRFVIRASLLGGQQLEREEVATFLVNRAKFYRDRVVNHTETELQLAMEALMQTDAANAVRARALLDAAKQIRAGEHDPSDALKMPM